MSEWFPLNKIAKALNVNPDHPNLINDLNSWLDIGDPLADEVIRSFAENGSSIPHDIVSLLIKEYDADVEQNHHDERRQAFWKSINHIPIWVDTELINEGQLVYWKNAPAIQVVLLFGTLVGGFSSPRINRVLIKTGYLSNRHKIYRRILETAQMINHAMIPNSLHPRASGWESIIQARLLHAMVRYRQQNHERPPLYDEVPINQTDQIGTILGFQCTVLIGLAYYFGTKLSVREKEAYTHLWRLIAHYMGLEDLANPCQHGFEASTAALRDYLHLYFKPDVEGSNLANGILEAVSNRPHNNIPLEYSAAMSRLLISSKLADALNLPTATFGWTLLARLSLLIIRLTNALAYTEKWGPAIIESRMQRFSKLLKQEIARHHTFSLKLDLDDQGDGERREKRVGQKSAALFFGGALLFIIRSIISRWTRSTFGFMKTILKI